MTLHPGALPPRLQLQRRLRQIGVIRSGLRGHRGVGSALRERFGGAPAPGITDMMDLPPSLHRVHLACEQAYNTYRPESYAGPVLLVHAARQHERQADPLPLWRRLVPLLEVEDIEVRHLGLIEHPAVVQVAAALNRRLTASPLDAEDDEPPPPFAPFVVADSMASTNKPTVIGPS